MSKRFNFSPDMLILFFKISAKELETSLYSPTKQSPLLLFSFSLFTHSFLALDHTFFHYFFRKSIPIAVTRSSAGG